MLRILKIMRKTMTSTETINYIINYAYTNPYQTTTAAIALGSLAIFAPGAIPEIFYLAAAHPKVTLAASCVAYEIFAKPYMGKYINSLLHFDEHPYAATIVLGGAAIYSGLPNIISENFKYMYSHKPLLSLMISVSASIFGVSTYLLGRNEALAIGKSCLEQTISIELTTDLCLVPNKNIIFVPILGFYSSCFIRKATRAYYLTEEDKKFPKNISC
jgi:hypothetical protein